MAAHQFKTNIKCGACVSKVTPALDELVGTGNWSVDLKTPERKLTVESTLSALEVADVIQKAGYNAEPLS